MIKKSIFLFSLFLALCFNLNAQEGGTKAEDTYDYDNALVVLHINEVLPVEFEDYVCYTKSFGRNGVDEITISVQVITSNNYHMIELVTWGYDGYADGGGLGMSQNVFAYNAGGWDFQKDTQAIYAMGNNFKEALKDLEMKSNGLNGTLSFTATGDPTKGKAVITIKKK